MASTKEYLAIKHYYVKLIDTLGKTVDPAHFARRLGEKSLVNDGKLSMWGNWTSVSEP